MLGSNGGRLFLRRNEGTKEKAAFATDSEAFLARGAPASIPGSECIPFVVDWDGDGLFDLVSGSGSGGVYWLRNVGRNGAPTFDAPSALIPGEPPVREPQRAPGDPLSDPHPDRRWPGHGTQACVTDFDGDGDLDVLVGDHHAEMREGEATRDRHGWVWLFRNRGPAAAKGSAASDAGGSK